MTTIASVYNYQTKMFDYYECLDPQSLGVVFGQTRAPVGFDSRIGKAPEALCMPLPAAAQHVGSGSVAKGVMCRAPSLGGLGDVTIGDESILKFGLLATVVGLFLGRKTPQVKWLMRKVTGK